MSFMQTIISYWTYDHIEANGLIIFNLVGALFLGLLLGYERTYHGRAAGMRTYGLVCMAAAGIVSINAYPELWYGARMVNAHFYADPTRSIQGIVTGIGFLCAGVIMKEGFNISGLTTAASVWTASAVGILVGVGLYGAAIVLVLCSIFCMTVMSRLEMRLPGQSAVAVSLKFKEGFVPDLQSIKTLIQKSDYVLAQSTISITHQNGCTEWRFAVLAFDRRLGASLPQLASELQSMSEVEDLRLSYARN